MYTLIVGREGNQPFPITEEGVGRQHLQVLVPDRMDGDWVVRDLNSANGTFVQRADGSFEQMYGVQHFSWDTVVRMGPANMYGRTFWLCQLTQTDPNDYSLQFRKINRQLNTFIEEKKQQAEEQERQRTRKNFIRALILAVISAGLIYIIPPEYQTARFAVLPIAGAIVPLLLQKKKVDCQSKDYKAIFRCPNGKCGRPLTEFDIRRGFCPACKAHM